MEISEEAASALKPFRLPIQVRFRDLDSLGHINNAVYSTYFEQLRVEFMERAGLGAPLSNAGRMPVILARTEIDFLKPGLLNDRISLSGWISHVGGKSFSVSCAAESDQRGMLARARAVLVWFDYEASISCVIPDLPRKTLTRLLLSDSAT